MAALQIWSHASVDGWASDAEVNRTLTASRDDPIRNRPPLCESRLYISSRATRLLRLFSSPCISRSLACLLSSLALCHVILFGSLALRPFILHIIAIADLNPPLQISTRLISESSILNLYPPRHVSFDQWITFKSQGLGTVRYFRINCNSIVVSGSRYCFTWQGVFHCLHLF